MTPDPTLQDVVKALATIAPKMTAHLEQLKRSNNLIELLRVYGSLKSLNDAIESITKIFSDAENDLSTYIIPDMMETLKVDKMTVEDTLYYVGVRTHANIVSSEEKDAHDWLAKEGYGAIVVPKVNPKTLSSAMTAYIREKGLKPPEELIRTFQKKYVAARKT